MHSSNDVNCVVLVLASFKVMVISFLALLADLITQPCVRYSEEKQWFRFCVRPDRPVLLSSSNGNSEPQMNNQEPLSMTR